MADHKSFMPLLLLVWTLVALSLGGALLSIQDKETDTAATEQPRQASAPLPPVRPTTVLTEPPPAPAFAEYPPAETAPPPNRTQTTPDKKPFPILEFIAIQIFFIIFSAAYIRARFKQHLDFLLKHHPTLGNFTNVKYTHIRFISIGDIVFLTLIQNSVITIFYFYHFSV